MVAHAAIALDPNESTDGLPVLVPLSRDFQAENTLTWLGHSSFLMRIGGKTMLLDPVLVDHLRAPYLPTGHRMVPQVPVLDRLDGLDIILISHGHNDHTNRATLEELRARFPAARAIAPASVEPLLRDIGFGSVTGLNHHEETQAGAIRFISVPVHHALRGTSRLSPENENPTAWVIEHGSRRILFAADTGYGRRFAETRERYGRISLALVPIGNYEPPEVFCDIHATPEQAARIARDVGAALAIGHHWGSYLWGRESPAETRSRFQATSGSGFRAIVLDLGQTVRIPGL